MAIFDEKIEIRERCKGVHCVDLGESFPTSIYLQKSASIQPRTSSSKFGGKFNSIFIRLLTHKSSGHSLVERPVQTSLRLGKRFGQWPLGRGKLWGYRSTSRTSFICFFCNDRVMPYRESMTNPQENGRSQEKNSGETATGKIVRMY